MAESEQRELQRLREENANMLAALTQVFRINKHEDYTYDQKEDMIDKLFPVMAGRKKDASTTWVIGYVVSESGGHGEGRLEHTAIWKDAGAFETEEVAKEFLAKTARQRPYGVSSPKPVQLVLHSVMP